MSRIDRFVEHLLSRYTLDIYERAEVETKFRDYLNGFINQGLARGLDRDRAECEAVRQFQYRSAFARLFNLPDNRICLALTGACFMIPLVVFAGHRMLFAYDYHRDAVWMFLASFALTPIFGWAYSKLRTRESLAIQNGIVFKPLLKKPEFIAFDQLIRIVKPPWGSKYEFRYEAGRRFVRPYPLMRLDLVVLGALADDVIDPELDSDLRRLRTVLRPETTTLRIVATIPWIALACIYIVGGLDLMWAGHGYPWPVAIVLACCPLIALAQTFRIPHRPRAALINAIGIAQLLPFFLLYYSAVLNGDTFQLREWALFTGLCFAMALIATWWRGSVKPLLTLAFCMAVFFFCVRESIRPPYIGNQIELSSGFALFPTWIDNGQTAAWFGRDYNHTTDRVEEYFNISKNGALPKKFLLPPNNGFYRHYPPPPGKRIAIFHVEWRDRACFYLNFLNADDSLETMTLPFRVSDSRSDDTEWSPDGRYFCTGNSVEYHDANTTLCCLDTRTGRMVDTSYFDGRGRLAWTGPHTLKICRITTDAITVQQVDLHAARVETLHRYPNEPYYYYPYVLPGLHYARMGLYLFNLDTGQRTKLPYTQAEGIGSYDWDPQTERLAYFTNQTIRPNERDAYSTVLVYQAGRGIVARHDFESPRYVDEIKLSPDGERLFMLSSVPDPRLYRGEWGQFTHTIGCTIRHREVLNLKTHEIIRLNSCDGLLPGIIEDVAWSPDSRRLLYQPCIPIRWIIDRNTPVVQVTLK